MPLSRVAFLALTSLDLEVRQEHRKHPGRTSGPGFRSSRKEFSALRGAGVGGGNLLFICFSFLGVLMIQEKALVLNKNENMMHEKEPLLLTPQTLEG